MLLPVAVPNGRVFAGMGAPNPSSPKRRGSHKTKTISVRCCAIFGSSCSPFLCCVLRLLPTFTLFEDTHTHRCSFPGD